MSSFSMDTRSISSSPLVNSLDKNRLFKTAPDIDEPPFQFIHTVNLSVVDTMLHDSTDLVIHRTDIWIAWRPQVGCKKVWRFLTQKFNCCTWAARCADALSCWNTKSLPDTLRIAGSSMMSLWRREAASKKSVRAITRISCSVTPMKLPHALQVYSSFYDSFQGSAATNYRWSGKFNYVLWADNLCLQQWKKYKNRTVFEKVMIKWKRVQFFLTHSVLAFYTPSPWGGYVARRDRGQYSREHYAVIDRTRKRRGWYAYIDDTTTPEYRHVISGSATPASPSIQKRHWADCIAGAPAAAAAAETVVVRIPITCWWQRRKFGWKCRSVSLHKASGFQSRRIARAHIAQRREPLRGPRAYSIRLQIAFCANMTN